ncbi:GCN5 family N-acetyltransferase [Thalassobacillus devorans]|uniref:GCN5 family N-acetyltransferase n=1 Tax=Thalassobacillus devorans TaxID=279813 RepID=A0ABQ1NH52_9BACI|nr:GNAT family N-acetyltransferase [Thalassobacillus devorans]NIK27356.1 RimJ/RimL family protein N-acetyltransferase [Thalassobacillus devorans]GGC77090.1 GCN5 family N-acetyltransferase [Thalassobacillus devorans]
MIVREIKVTDAKGLSILTKQVEDSSDYMLWEPEERIINRERQLKMIKSVQEKENSTILIAENCGALVGYLLAFGGSAKRNNHSAYIVIGISKDYRGQGIGTKLFRKLEEWAANHNIHRLELTTVTKNEAGLSLYKKMGFEIEGTKRHSLFINGKWIDEYFMAKLL